jgi:membrane associated rhomboid family serine protease
LRDRRGLVGRSAAWLFSPKHFHFKLLSGTAVGIVVITFLAGLFLALGMFLSALSADHIVAFVFSALAGLIYGRFLIKETRRA